MDQLDYQTECALINYPFKDSCSFLWSSGIYTGTLPKTVILDAVLTIGGSTIIQPTLNTIVYSGSSWVFNFSNSLSFTVTDVGGISTFAASTGYYILRIDIDTDSLANYFSTLSAGTYTFDSSCKLCVSSIKLLPPNITELKLWNTSQDNWLSSPSQLEVIDVVSGNLNLAEGSNFQIIPKSYGVTTNVLPNKGEGLFDSCSPITPAILTINNAQPNSTNNISISAGSCYSIMPSTNSLILSNNCDASCSPTVLVDFAHYLNRITDGTVQLNTYASTLNTIYNELLSDYSTSLTTPKNPYIVVQNIPQSNKVNNYFNITCGIYNPSPVASIINIDAIYSSSFSVVTKSGYANINNNRIGIEDPTLISGVAAVIHNITVPPNSVSYVGFVLQAPLLAIISDITVTLSNVVGGTPIPVSSYIVSTSTSSFNYNISYSVVTEGLNKIISMFVDLYDNTYPTSSSTTLTITPPGYFTTTISNLIADSVTTTQSANGFSGISLDYTKINQYQFVISCAASVTGNQIVNISGFDTSGVLAKLLTIAI